MEPTLFGQNQACGLWKMMDNLGTGAFAHVYLYQNMVSNHYAMSMLTGAL